MLCPRHLNCIFVDFCISALHRQASIIQTNLNDSVINLPCDQNDSPIILSWEPFCMVSLHHWKYFGYSRLYFLFYQNVYHWKATQIYPCISLSSHFYFENCFSDMLYILQYKSSWNVVLSVKTYLGQTNSYTFIPTGLISHVYEPLVSLLTYILPVYSKNNVYIVYIVLMLCYLLHNKWHHILTYWMLIHITKVNTKEH